MPGSDDKQDKFEQLLRPLMGMAYRYALRLARDPDRAQDLVQDACLKAFERWGELRQEDKFRAWLLRIVYTTFIDERRRFSRRGESTYLDERFSYGDSRPGERLMATVAGPEQELMKKELGGKIRKALDELPEQYRLPVFLAYAEGLSYEEVAAALDCPVGTVMSRLFRGRKMLREKLEEYVPLLAS
jgi:RNA polymerase sigma-70 factor (ECF subfamily)